MKRMSTLYFFFLKNSVQSRFKIIRSARETMLKENVYCETRNLCYNCDGIGRIHRTYRRTY